MLEIWSWICELPYSDEWAVSDSPLVRELASNASPIQKDSYLSMQLIAERTSTSNSETMVTFKVCLQGFNLDHNNALETLWVSDTCPLSAEKPFLPLLLQLLNEIITRSPTAYDCSCLKSRLRTLKPDPVVWIMDSHSPQSFSSFFNLIFLTRLFWLCVCEAPAEVGSFYFQSLLGPNLEALTCSHAPVLRTFFISSGVDVELCLMRTMGYVLTKWLLSREIRVGLQVIDPLPCQVQGFSYATEAHGLWILKGYVPLLGMRLTNSRKGQISKFPLVESKETVLRYALAHQQLDTILQLEYSVKFHNGYIQVSARVNNLRLHVSRLAFKKNDNADYTEEKHFPTRIRISIGPEVGSSYVFGLTLSRSTNNEERQIEIQRLMKGSYGKSKVPKIKTRARMSTKMKMKNWRCDQDAEGNTAIFDVVLCDNETGQEIINLTNPINKNDSINNRRISSKYDDDDDDNNNNNNNNNNNVFKNRYEGANRSFTKSGGLVFAGDEYGEEVGWRLSKEMEGSVLKWRIGVHVWLSYWANNVKSSYHETRFVEWCDEVDLPLISGK